MSATRTIASYDLSNLRLRHRSHATILNPYYHLEISSSKHGRSFLANQGLSLNVDGRRMRSKSNMKMDMSVYCSVQPGAPLPAGSPSNSWKSWVLGAILSIILPFWKNKWSPLLTLKREVDTVVETLDTVVEVLEAAATEVERVADEVADKLPDGGKLKEAVRFVENIAKEAAKDAHLVDEFIHKVEEVEEEVEKEVETLVEPAVLDQGNVVAKGASEQK